MFTGAYSIATVCLIITAIRAKEREQCPDLPAPIKFYRGEPDDSDFGGLKNAVEDIFGSLFNVLSKMPSSGNETDLSNFNFSNFFSDGNDTLVGDNDQSSTTAVPSTSKPKSPISEVFNGFNIGYLMNSIIPTHLRQNTSTENAATSNRLLHVGSLLGELKPTVAPKTNFIEISVEEDTNLTWGIVVPANTIRLQIVKLNESRLVNSFELDAEQLRNPRHKINRKKFVRNVNLSDYDVQPDLFYIVCVNLALIQDGQSHECQRCALIKSYVGLDSDSKQKIIDFQAANSRVHPYDARLHFFIHDLPLANVSLVTRVQSRQADLRCPILAVYKKPEKFETRGFRKSPSFPEPSSSSPESLILPETFDRFERVDRILPYNILYVDVQHLAPKQAYKVEGDLLIGFDNFSAVPFDWANPLIIKDYFGVGPKSEYVIGACGRPF